MTGLAIVAGVGFTVALFVASLSFHDPSATDAAKVGILAGSVIAGAVGWATFRGAKSPLGGTAGTATTAEVSR